jgi:hypothetical protein
MKQMILSALKSRILISEMYLDSIHGIGTGVTLCITVNFTKARALNTNHLTYCKQFGKMCYHK